METQRESHASLCSKASDEMPCKTWPTNDVLACKFEVNSPFEVDLGLKPQGIRLPSLRDWLCVLGGIQQPRSGNRCQPPRSRLRLSVGINTTIAASDGPQQARGNSKLTALALLTLVCRRRASVGYLVIQFSSPSVAANSQVLTAGPNPKSSSSASHLVGD